MKAFIHSWISFSAQPSAAVRGGGWPLPESLNVLPYLSSVGLGHAVLSIDNILWFDLSRLWQDNTEICSSNKNQPGTGGILVQLHLTSLVIEYLPAAQHWHINSPLLICVFVSSLFVPLCHFCFPTGGEEVRVHRAQELGTLGAVNQWGHSCAPTTQTNIHSTPITLLVPLMAVPGCLSRWAEKHKPIFVHQTCPVWMIDRFHAERINILGQRGACWIACVLHKQMMHIL